MITGYRFAQFAGLVFLCLSLGIVPANADAAHTQRKTAAKKTPPQPQLPPLPSGPTGPVPQIPLDSIAPVAPQVSYQNGQLTIVANNSTLGDILRAVRKQTGAEIEIPVAGDRVVTHLGPGPAQEVLSELLNGSRFNYVLLGSPEKAGTLTRVVLVAKTGGAPENAVANNQPQQATEQVANADPQEATDTSDPDPPAESVEETPDQPTEAEQAAPTDQPETKTPQQMLQEMQQRQLQLQQQQQQQPGQPPVPGLPGRPQFQQQQPQQDQQ
jgi:hypothetical protein